MKYWGLHPIDDLEIMMDRVAAVVHHHAPGYRGKVSLEFDIPYPPDPRARFRANTIMEPPIGPRSREPFCRFATASAIGLDLGLAIRDGWLDYNGDIVIRLHSLPVAEPLVVDLRDGNILAFEFGPYQPAFTA